MALCVSVIEPDRWGAGKRLPKCLEYLSRYGIHAKALLPDLQSMRAFIAEGERGTPLSENLQVLDKAIAAITASTASPDLVELAEFTTRL